MERHGGKIGVTSSGIPGKGCMFYIELAVDDWQATSAPSSPTSHFSRHPLDLSTNPSSPSSSSSSSSSSDSVSSTKPLLQVLEIPTFKAPASTYLALDELDEEREMGGFVKVWRALIVDDSKLNVKMARRVLHGYFDEILEVSHVEKQVLHLSFSLLLSLALSLSLSLCHLFSM